MSIKTFSKDFIIYGLGIVITRLVSILLLPIITEYLTVQEIGLIEMMNSLISMGMLFCLSGIDTALSFYYWDSKDDAAEQKRYIITSTIIIVLITIPLLVVIYILLPILEKHYFRVSMKGLYLHLILTIPLAAFFKYTTKLFRIRKKAIKFSLISFGNAILFFFGILLIIKKYPGIKSYYFAKNAAYLLAIISGIILFIRKNKSSIRDNTTKETKYYKNLISYGFPLLPLLLSSWLITNTDRFFLNHYFNLQVVGEFAITYKLSSMVALFLSAFTMVWGPYSMSVKDKPNAPILYSKMTLIFVYLSLLAIITIQMFSKFIVIIFTSNSENYLQSTNLFTIIALSLVLTSFFSISAVGLNIVKKTYLISIGSFIAVLVNLLSNFYLVKNYGMLGASISSNIAYLITCIFILVISRKLYPIKYNYVIISLLFVLFAAFYYLYVIESNMRYIIIPAYLSLGLYIFKKHIYLKI